MNDMLKHGAWNLADLAAIPRNGLKVFSCFHCGGGSTMGYKLAGYDVVGGVEIDPRIMGAYRTNHHPAHSYLMGVQQFKQLPDSELPEALFDLDVLDGSPPCSSFSLAGARERKWGVAFKFREGQANQVLDDLFFHYIDIAAKLNPKVVIAENVKGLIVGKAKGYVKQIFSAFSQAGYDTQLFLLNAAAMGVPQARERTFFIARRKDLNLPPLDLHFNEPPIGMESALADVDISGEKITYLTPETLKLWQKTEPGNGLDKVHPKGHRFNDHKLHPKRPANTLTTQFTPMHWQIPRRLTDRECIRMQTFPDDYNFCGMQVKYICGMSVPPYMMQRLAAQIARQIFRK